MRQAVSRTATLVALYRAMESSRSAGTRLFEDPLAPAFLGVRAASLSTSGRRCRRAMVAHRWALVWAQRHGGSPDAIHR